MVCYKKLGNTTIYNDTIIELYERDVKYPVIVDQLMIRLPGSGRLVIFSTRSTLLVQDRRIKLSRTLYPSSHMSLFELRRVASLDIMREGGVDVLP